MTASRATTGATEWLHGRSVSAIRELLQHGETQSGMHSWMQLQLPQLIRCEPSSQE